jgi:hypothetical protein
MYVTKVLAFDSIFCLYDEYCYCWLPDHLLCYIWVIFLYVPLCFIVCWLSTCIHLLILPWFSVSSSYVNILLLWISWWTLVLFICSRWLQFCPGSGLFWTCQSFWIFVCRCSVIVLSVQGFSPIAWVYKALQWLSPYRCLILNDNRWMETSESKLKKKKLF